MKKGYFVIIPLVIISFKAIRHIMVAVSISFNRDNGKLKISEVEQTALYLQSLQIESCLLLAIRFSDTDSWCPCILVLGYSIFS